MHDIGCSGLVHWDDPEGWDGEGGGMGVQDGEHGAQLASIRQMSGQVSRGSAGKYQTDDQAGVAGLSWRVSGR